MANNNEMQNRLSTGSVIWGFIFGFIVGGGVALFKAPKRGSETRQDIVEAVTPVDRVAESLATGKALAQERLNESRSRLASQ